MDLSVEGKTERIPPGSHICQLYSKVTERPGVTARLMRGGFTLSEKCLFAAAPAKVKELREELQKLQLNVGALRGSAQLVLDEEREMSLPTGKRCDPDLLDSQHERSIA